MSVSWGERGIERESGTERELIKRRVAAGKAQIVRGLHAEGVTTRRVSRERERKGVGGGALIGTPSHSEIVMLWPLMAST